MIAVNRATYSATAFTPRIRACDGGGYDVVRGLLLFGYPGLFSMLSFLLPD